MLGFQKLLWNDLNNVLQIGFETVRQALGVCFNLMMLEDNTEFEQWFVLVFFLKGKMP